VASGVAADLVEAAAEARATLRRHAGRVREGLRAQGWDVPGDGIAPIVPVHVGDPARTMAISAQLLERGVFVQGIRPPTVPEGTSRLRVVPTASHLDEHVDALLDAFAAVRRGIA